MDDRERFRRVMSFQPVDRVPNWEFGVWPQTVDRWLQEGMPCDIPESLDKGLWIQGGQYFGLDRQIGLEIRMGMIPTFEAETIEEDERYVVVRNSRGVLTRALKEGTKRGTRMSMDTYLDFPMKTRADFEAMQWRYNPKSPARYPEWWDDYVRKVMDRDCPLRAPSTWGGNSLNSFYGQMRDWMGTERACTIFLDEPQLAHDILDFIADFIIETLHPALDAVQPDYFIWFEDYAYKGGPLISPKIFKTFLLPPYRRVNDFLRAHGIDVIFQDSDGNPSILFPLMIEAGINGHWPLEAASGMDPVKVRKQYGHDLRLIGGIDKRMLAQDKQAIEAELYAKLPPLLEDGGYIPTPDHLVPPDVSYENWLYYLELKKKLLAGHYGV
jgi:uroporphyrinogen decarboxylase